MRGRGCNTGGLMSGHLRFGLTAFLLVAGYVTPAAANPFTDLFSPNPAPEAATAAPTPAPAGCLRQPGPAAAGRHWVYRYDGHSKCWFQAAEGSALAQRAGRHHVALHGAAAAEENEPAPKAVEDAHDEVVTPAPADTPEPTLSTPKLTIVHTVPVRVADAAAPVPPAPVPATPAVNQPAPDQPASNPPGPRQVDVEKLLADGPVVSDKAAAPPSATPVGAGTDGGAGRTANWLGAVLMALGCAALLSSSLSLRRRLGSVRFPNAGTELAVAAQGGESDRSGAEHIPPAGARRDELLRFDPQSMAPLAHAGRTRRPVAPEPPAEVALWEDGIGALAALTTPASPGARTRSAR